MRKDPMGKLAELFERHKAVLPSWAPVYYKEPIAIAVRSVSWH